MTRNKLISKCGDEGGRWTNGGGGTLSGSHLVYPRIEVHSNVIGQKWFRYLTGYSQHDIPFATKPKNPRAFIASQFSDPEGYAVELRKVPIFDLSG